jgi:hypothetical protein
MGLGRGDMDVRPRDAPGGRHGHTAEIGLLAGPRFGLRNVK